MWCIIVVEHPHFGVRVRFVIWEYKKNKGNHEHRCIIVFELPAIMQSTHTANYHWLLKYTLYELSAANTTCWMRFVQFFISCRTTYKEKVLFTAAKPPSSFFRLWWLYNVYRFTDFRFIFNFNSTIVRNYQEKLSPN